MTIEEINSLTLDDVRTIVTTRVITKYGDALDEKPALLDDMIDKEFEVYIAELLDAENERLDSEAEVARVAQEAAAEVARQVEKERIDGLILRMKSVGNDAFHAIYNVPNVALWVRDNISKNQDHVDAEEKVVALEAKVAEIEADPATIKAKWIEELEEELATESITKDGLLEALVRHVILEDSTLLNIIKPKLQAIDIRKPRPQG